MAENFDSRDLDRDIAMAGGAHDRLLDALDALVASGALDVSAPSALPGWTKGHVLTHITNSGDGHIGIFEAAEEGRIVYQYPGGVEGRAADIEAGADRPVSEQVEELRISTRLLEDRWAESTWAGSGIGPLGEVEIVELPFFRMREVGIHHVDLDVGFTFADLPPEYLRLELRRMEMLWKARQPMGMTSLPEQALTMPEPDRLAWLLGRIEADGLSPASIF